jgi:hypothetical protein
MCSGVCHGGLCVCGGGVLVTDAMCLVVIVVVRGGGF